MTSTEKTAGKMLAARDEARRLLYRRESFCSKNARPSEFAPVKLDQVVEYDAMEEHGGSLDFERDQRSESRRRAALLAGELALAQLEWMHGAKPASDRLQ